MLTCMQGLSQVLLGGAGVPVAPAVRQLCPKATMRTEDRGRAAKLHALGAAVQADNFARTLALWEGIMAFCVRKRTLTTDTQHRSANESTQPLMGMRQECIRSP